MKKGSGTVELHRAFMTLLSQRDEKTKLRIIDQIFWELMKDVKTANRRAAAARTLLAWGVGMPQQMVKVTLPVNMTIGVAKGLESLDLEHLENVEISRPEKEADAGGGS